MKRVVLIYRRLCCILMMMLAAAVNMMIKSRRKLFPQILYSSRKDNTIAIQPAEHPAQETMDVPQIFKEDLSGWNWTIPDCPNLAVLEKFEAALEQLQRMLKENIAIDRRAASFFRIATKPIGVSQGTAAHQRIKLTADYLLDEKADNIEENDVYYLADVGEMARGMQCGK